MADMPPPPPGFSLVSGNAPPPPPEGFKLKTDTPPPPPGFTMKSDGARSFMESMKERAGEGYKELTSPLGDRKPTTPEKGESAGQFVMRAAKKDLPEGLSVPLKMMSGAAGIAAAPGGALGETVERAVGKAVGANPEKLEKAARDTGDLMGAATVAALPGGKNIPEKAAVVEAPKGELPKVENPPPAVEPKPASQIFSPDQPIASAKGVSTTEGVADKLYQSRQAVRADYKEFSKWGQQFKAVPKEFWQKALDHADDPKGVPLTPEEKLVYDRSIGVMEKEINANRAEIKQSGFDPNYLEEESGSLGGAVRQRKGMDTPLDKMTGEKSRAPEGGKSISRAAGTFKGRNMMALEDGGKRTIVHIDDEGNVIDAGNKNEVLGRVDPDTEAFQGKGKIVEATRKEIEAATEGKVQYHDNAFGVYGTTLMQTRRAVRSTRLLEDIKKSPDFMEVARKPGTPGKNLPKGWKEIDSPEFKGWRFEPRYAEEIEDFIHGIKRDMGALNKLDKVNRFTLGLLFWANPIHAYNITEAFFVTKGAGNLLKDLPGTIGDLTKSIKSVATRDKYNMQQARSGVPMPGLDTAGEEFRRMTLDVMGVKMRQDPKTMMQFAKEFGFNKPEDFIKKVSELSHKAVFSWQDVLQQTLERGYMREGMTQAQATEKIAKTFMNYRTPSRVMDQRWMGQALQGQAWLDFPKYSYGRMKGLYNILRGSAKLDPHSIDQLLTVALLYEFGKVAIDPLIKQYTGKDNAEFGSYGYAGPLDTAVKMSEGQRTPGQALQSMFSLGYVPQAMFGAAGVDPYTSKPVSLPGESPGDVGMDYASMMANKLSPVQRMGQVSSGRMDPSDLFLEQMGVKFPGDISESKSMRRQLKAREKYGTKLEQELGQ